MKIEYLPTGSDDCPLIRLYEFGHPEVEQLLASVDLLAKGQVVEMSLHEAPYVESVDGCRLYLKTGKKDIGVVETGDNSFDWILTDEGWDDLVWLARPFLDGILHNRFQWLDERTDISVLFSPDGGW
jgi:hypothetical protein